VLTDGITIYYASDNENSMGGYDIFVTRYNTGTDTFLNPETFAEQKAGLGSEERSRGRQPTERAIRYNQEINLLYPCASEIIHHRHYIPK
jgi:hypothetical protein